MITKEDRKPKINVKNKVIWALTNFPELRDDKRAICRKIWEEEMKKDSFDFSLLDFMNGLINKKLSSPETILRWWRLIQQNPKNIPEWSGLRGKNYNSRHGIQVEEAQKHFEVGQYAK